MMFFELLENNLTKKSKAMLWLNKLRQNPEHYYPWIANINIFLKTADDARLKILENKFYGVHSVDQLLDKLTEIIVATSELIDKIPEFLDDSFGGPDIYLQKDSFYVEVKHLNNSDEQKLMLDHLSDTQVTKDGLVQRHGKDNIRCKIILNKAIELIEKGLKQIGGKSGFVYLACNIDLIPTFFANNEQIFADIKNDLEKMYGAKIKVERFSSLFKQCPAVQDEKAPEDLSTIHSKIF